MSCHNKGRVCSGCPGCQEDYEQRINDIYNRGMDFAELDEVIDELLARYEPDVILTAFAIRRKQCSTQRVLSARRDSAGPES